MDLRSIINTEANDASARKQATPITPVQGGVPQQPQQSLREYNPPVQPTMTKHPSHDYNSGSFTSPIPYQGVYQGRPAAPPPLQPPSQNDIRSPATSSHYSTQSPYTRHTPSSSISGQYPFPQHQTPQSPAQAHQYPSTLQQRESYPQSTAPPPHLQHHNSYGQPSPAPNTPPVGTPGGTHPFYQHQRSQSSQSTSTPTSAQSQHYYNQYTQDSPVSASSFPHAQVPQHQRQQSQPATPLGPPLSNPRQTSGSYPQPSSPYQQRPQSSSASNLGSNSAHQSPVASHPQVNKLPSTPNIYELHRGSAGELSRKSQPVRERSLSVSPKTQIPGLPGTTEHSPFIQPNIQSMMTEESQIQPQKRKMEESETPEPNITGRARNGEDSRQDPAPSALPLQARKRRRYAEPPIWARSVVGRNKYNGALLTAKRVVNGKQSVKAVHPSATGPNAISNGHSQIANSVPSKPPYVAAKAEDKGDGPLGPWEASIIGIKPYEEISKMIADWLFLEVVQRPDAAELASRGVEIEIEAKLGQLISKDTNERLRLPVLSECLLVDNGRVSFKSSMTEAQHKTLNDFLNVKVTETHPENPNNRTKPRIPIVYSHRRERDRFYELHAAGVASLPEAIRAQLNPRHAVKVRVTSDQKTGQQLAKIIKARVADLDIHNPRFPLDCRISVNLEMRYDGDIESLVSSSETPSRIPDRNKDRLSYTHSHYQIDLTQVTVADPHAKIEKEHELEIEVSSVAVRDQGQRALRGEPQQYLELIEGLMDNVRVLTRTVPDQTAVL